VSSPFLLRLSPFIIPHYYHYASLNSPAANQPTPPSTTVDSNSHRPLPHPRLVGHSTTDTNANNTITLGEPNTASTSLEINALLDTFNFYSYPPLTRTVRLYMGERSILVVCPFDSFDSVFVSCFSFSFALLFLVGMSMSGPVRLFVDPARRNYVGWK